MPIPVLIAQAEPLARRLLEERRLAGLVVGVAFEGVPVFAGTYGHADVEAGRPMRADTAVRIGSITKTFTALAVAQLVEGGLVGWDDPIERHLRAYRFRAARGARAITIRDVLTHTSGMGEWRRLREARAKSIPFGVDDGQPVPTLTEFYRRGLRADTPPGQRYSYANHAMATLGQLVEDVTGTPFATFMKARILDPLGMAGADLLLTPEVRSRLAQGYTPGDGKPEAVPYQHIAIGPAGSLHAGLDDMLRYAAWLTAPHTNDIVQPATLATMFERHWELDRRLPGHGLAWGRDEIAGEAVVFHDGGWPGFVASLQVVPGRQFAVFAATNTFDLAPRVVTDALVGHLLEAPEPSEQVAAGQVTAHPDVIRRIAGVYAPARGFSSNGRWWNEYGGEVRIDASGGGLRLSTPKGSYTAGVPLVPGDADDPLFWMGAAARLGTPCLLRLRFSEDAGGQVTGFAAGLPSHATMRKRPLVRSVRFYKPALKVAAAAGVATVAALLATRVIRRPRSALGRTGRTVPRPRPR